jgi:5-methylcytosine-specific restriction enzyme subunit McrC
MPAYTLREWDKLEYGGEKGKIPPQHADKLAIVAAGSVFAGRSGGGVIEHGRHAIRARGVVGILASGDVSLEILPKIDVAPGEPLEIQNAAIRERLVYMLGVALDLKIDLGSMTNLSWQNDTLLEILIRVFCEKLTAVLRKGMPRRYLECDEDLPSLRGRLDVTRQFTRHAVDPSRLACRFDILSENIAINQIMKAAVRRLLGISRRNANQQRRKSAKIARARIRLW